MKRETDTTLSAATTATAVIWRTYIQLLQISLYGKKVKDNTLANKLEMSLSTIRRYVLEREYTADKYRKFMDNMAKGEGKRIVYTSEGEPEIKKQNGLERIELVSLEGLAPTYEADPVRMFADLSKAFRRDGGRYHGDYLLVGQKTKHSKRADWGNRSDDDKSVFYVWPLQIKENGLVVMRTEHPNYHNYGVLYNDDQCLSFLFLTFGIGSDPDSLSPRLGNVIFRVEDRGFRSDLFDAEIGVSAKRSSSRAAKAEECILIKIDDFFDRYPTSFTVEYSGNDDSVNCLNLVKVNQQKWKQFMPEIYLAKNGFLKSAFQYLHELPRHIRIDVDANDRLKALLALNHEKC